MILGGDGSCNVMSCNDVVEEREEKRRGYNDLLDSLERFFAFALVLSF
jgi:hypothetical protein